MILNSRREGINVRMELLNGSCSLGGKHLFERFGRSFEDLDKFRMFLSPRTD